MDSNDSSTDSPAKKAKTAQKLCLAFGSPAWTSSYDSVRKLAKTTRDNQKSAWTVNQSNPVPTDVLWTPSTVVSKSQQKCPDTWSFFGDKWLSTYSMPPSFVKLSDAWVARVIVAENLTSEPDKPLAEPHSKPKEWTASFRGKAWNFDFNSNGIIRSTRFPRGKAVIVNFHGELFIPVVKYFYVLCGEDLAFRYAAWLINGIPTGEQKAAALSPNILHMGVATSTSSFTAVNRLASNTSIEGMVEYKNGARLSFDDQKGIRVDIADKIGTTPAGADRPDDDGESVNSVITNPDNPKENQPHQESKHMSTQRKSARPTTRSGLPFAPRHGRSASSFDPFASSDPSIMRSSSLTRPGLTVQSNYKSILPFSSTIFPSVPSADLANDPDYAIWFNSTMHSSETMEKLRNTGNAQTQKVLLREKTPPRITRQQTPFPTVEVQNPSLVEVQNGQQIQNDPKGSEQTVSELLRLSSPLEQNPFVPRDLTPEDTFEMLVCSAKQDQLKVSQLEKTVDELQAAKVQLASFEKTIDQLRATNAELQAKNIQLRDDNKKLVASRGEFARRIIHLKNGEEHQRLLKKLATLEEAKSKLEQANAKLEQSNKDLPENIPSPKAIMTLDTPTLKELQDAEAKIKSLKEQKKILFDLGATKNDHLRRVLRSRSRLQKRFNFLREKLDFILRPADIRLAMLKVQEKLLQMDNADIMEDIADYPNPNMPEDHPDNVISLEWPTDI
ncbi:hypothetical protein P170DRAFT_427987 [Aspergillus steynii IBT 23096]|uniref:Uncharacterized protein n=1 Tax=Aspergillus steynii IBT 23096 TaxID=1392250 RepID=A0A2I2G1E2_9EURO|nr:uncharacterized protein P170DRAFT_427987 [Aspergillus steynii IBT 23096]PLB46687.1 hypothetical protein P170DRAFT_427987 [Aspergillus steynii IBT 23096]